MRNSAQKISVALVGICSFFLGTGAAHAERLLITYKTAGVQSTARGVKDTVEDIPGSRVVKSLRYGAVVAVPSSQKKEAVEQLEDQQGVKEVEVDRRVHLLASDPNDTYWANLWGMTRIGLPGAWDQATGSGLIVGVIDTGVDADHPDLAANMWNNSGEIAGNGLDDDRNGIVDDRNGADFSTRDSLGRPSGNPADQNGHGTHVAGTVAAVRGNGAGVAGVAPGAKVMALRFMDASGSGYTSDAIAAIDYAVGKGAKILNNSWGGAGYSQGLSDAISRARSAGVLFVAAAGNEAKNIDQNPSYPAAYSQDNVLSIAATDSADNLASFSNRGVQNVDIGAPGVGIQSTYFGSRYATLSGTSMATPHVAGAAAWLWSARPAASYAQIRQALAEGGDYLSTLAGETAFGRRLNLAGALSRLDALLGSTPTPTPTPPPSALTPTSPPTVRAISGLVACDPGKWPLTGLRFAYSWTRNGSPIGASSSLLKIADNNWSGAIVCRVQASRDGTTGTAQSAPLVVPTPLVQVFPKLTGSTQVGKAVTCNPGKWMYGPVQVSYQWYSSFNLIPGANGSTYTPTASDAGRWVSCLVTASNGSGSSSFSSGYGLVRNILSRWSLR